MIDYFKTGAEVVVWGFIYWIMLIFAYTCLEGACKSLYSYWQRRKGIPQRRMTD